MRRMRAPKPKTGKKVSYKLIERDTEVGRAMYARLDEELGQDHHEDIQRARIVLAWCTSWRPDVDGRVVLGKCRRMTELEREFHRFDFCILLNQAWWYDLKVTDEQRVAILDHELCHASPVIDDRTNEQKTDERGRLLWRMRKHDVEDFHGVLQRRGTYKRDVELAYRALRQAAVGGFSSCGTCNSDGWVEGPDKRMGRSVVSADGRWRIAKVFLEWELLDRGVSLGGFLTRDAAISKVEHELLFERRRWERAS